MLNFFEIFNISKKTNFVLLESLDVVAMYDYENDEWGEEGQLTLARGSADATVSKIPRSYWTNKFNFQPPKLLFS